MTQNDLKSAIVTLKLEKKMANQKYTHLVRLFSNQDKDIVPDRGSVAKEQLKKAGSYIESNWNRCRNNVTRMIIDLELGDQKGDPIKEEDH